MYKRSLWTRCLLPAQFFSSNRFKPTNTYSINHENYLNGLACFPADAYLQKHPTPQDEEANNWRSRLLVVKDGVVHGTYQAPPVHPFPQSFAPEGISIEDYKNYVNMHDSHVFVFVVTRHHAFCGFMKKDATWLVTPWEQTIDRDMKENKMRTTRNSPVFTAVREFLLSQESRLDECPTLWYRVSPEHGILIPSSMINRRIRAENQFGAARWHEEDEREQISLPLGGDPRWTPMPSCPWPDLMHRDGIRARMDSGLVEVA